MTNTMTTVRSEVKKLASQIEVLAKQVSQELDTGTISKMLEAANELVKNTGTFTFVLGSLYQEERSMPVKTTKKAAKNGTRDLSKVRVNWWNQRDAQGRFIKKV